MKSGMFSTGLMVAVCACAAARAAEPAQVIHVDAGANGAGSGSSWADACIHLQDALVSAAGVEKPVEIHVAKGLYKPDQGVSVMPGDRLATFKLANGVTLKGGYAGAAAIDPNARDTTLYETILSGDLAGNDGGAGFTKDPGAISIDKDNSYHVVTGSGTDTTAVMDGFTITAGSMAPPRPAGDDALATGTGMLIDTGSPTVLNCCFRDTYPRATEVLAALNGSHPIVTNCTFLNNQGTGMCNVDNSNSIVTNCRFEGNSSGAMENRYSSPVITGCQFLDNGPTMIEAFDCNSVLTDCVFTGTDGTTRRQGLSASGGRLTLMGCTFTGFTKGAIETRDDLTLVRCTFQNNSGFMTGVVGSFFHPHVTAIKCVFIGNEGYEAGALSGGDIELHDCEFIGNIGSQAGAVKASPCRLIATGCVFAGNWSQSGPGAIGGWSDIFKLSNCTFVGNRGRQNCLDARFSGLLPTQITQCIFRDEPEPFGPESAGFTPRLEVSYSNVQGGYPGEGNIDVDPCFVDPGYWADPEDPTKPAALDDPNAVWITGDYHLKSQAGHWDRASQDWACDDVTSRCIDAGDPNAPVGAEPFPNGGFINMGAYGGTAEASRSYFAKPVCETQIAGDINGDCIVDQADLDILQLHWLMEGTEPVKVNNPPTITLLSPKDGDEFTDGEPIVLQCIASDADGTVIRVRYDFIAYWEEGSQKRWSTTGTTVVDPTDNWKARWSWSNIRRDCACEISAEAMDNEGARTRSQAVTVTLHPKP
ncbi:MAG: right-handed parallel beta-helix repeat-containing protein [Sedimentisphaerales bacterium]|nr:right-handed parallel beta-helix repeat-containing protein [Sedimentisphaerales bacterium]